MLKSNVGELIKKSKFKREWLMQELGVSANTLSNWATGKNVMSLEKAFQLAELLDVKVDDLYEYKKSPNSN